MSLIGRLLKNLPKAKSFISNSRSISYLAIQDESLEDTNARYKCIFKQKDADGWDVRQAMNDLAGYDAVPDPTVIIAGLKACRRLNDYAMAVRFLEMVKFKCGSQVDKIWPYIKQEVKPVAKEMGIDFPEDLGYDEPELYLQSVFDMSVI